MSMSKLARVLTLAATLAAINLVGMTAVAQAHTGEDPTSTRHRALGQVEVLATAAQQRATADATVRRLLARERFSVPDGAPTPAQPTPLHGRPSTTHCRVPSGPVTTRGPSS